MAPEPDDAECDEAAIDTACNPKEVEAAVDEDSVRPSSELEGSDASNVGARQEESTQPPASRPQPDDDPGKSKQPSSKSKRIPAEAFMKVCDLLYGRRVRLSYKLEDDAAGVEQVVEGILRKAQGRTSVKLLNANDEIVLIRVPTIVSLEAPDGTCISLVHGAQVASNAKPNETGGYPTEKPADKKALAPREKNLLGGLKYEIEKNAPAGGRKAVKGSEVRVFYDGRLAKNGQRFDKGELSFKLGTGAVIKGFDLGMEGMLEGEKRKITIPWKMAYGAEGNPPAIPPRADLVFSVELNSVD